jgi:hypothetical protein
MNLIDLVVTQGLNYLVCLVNGVPWERVRFE